MSSPLSPTIADIVLQDIETLALNKLDLSLPFYIRYVDDIALAAPKNKLGTILKTFNSFHKRIRFTQDTPNNNSLNFLDTTIIIQNKRIIFNWYTKPTFSGRYLHFESQHPKYQKIGTIIGLTDRAITLAHP